MATQSTTHQQYIDELLLLGQLLGTETAIFHHAVASKLGLGVTDIKTLSILLHEGSMTAGRLGHRLSLTTGAVTNIINRLARRNFVRRTVDAHDKRQVTVEANTQATMQIDKIYHSVGDAFGSIFRDYSTAELHLLANFHEKAIEALKQETSKLQ